MVISEVLVNSDQATAVVQWSEPCPNTTCLGATGATARPNGQTDHFADWPRDRSGGHLFRPWRSQLQLHAAQLLHPGRGVDAARLDLSDAATVDEHLLHGLRDPRLTRSAASSLRGLVSRRHRRYGTRQPSIAIVSCLGRAWIRSGRRRDAGSEANPRWFLRLPRLFASCAASSPRAQDGVAVRPIAAFAVSSPGARTSPARSRADLRARDVRGRRRAGFASVRQMRGVRHRVEQGAQRRAEVCADRRLVEQAGRGAGLQLRRDLRLERRDP